MVIYPIYFKTIESINYNLMQKFHKKFNFFKFPSNLVGMITSPPLIYRTNFSSFGAILSELGHNC